MYKIEQIETLIYNLQSLKKSPKFFIFEYFENIKADVDLRRERLKQEIDQCSDAVIEEIETDGLAQNVNNGLRHRWSRQI